MPRRWLDPALFTDEKLAKAQPVERLLFTALIANQDDDGRLLAHPGYLRSIAFPYDEFSLDEVKKMRDHLAEVNPNVIVYENAGHEYIQLRRHARYQRPRYYHPSKLPAPPGWPFEVGSPKNDYRGDVEKTIQYEIANKLRSGQWQPTNEGIKDVELNKRLGNLYTDIFATTVFQTYILIEVKQYPLQFRDLGQVLDYRKEAEARGLTPIKTYLIGKGLGNLSLEEALSSSVTLLNLDLTEIKFITPTSEDVVTPTYKEVDATWYTKDKIGLDLDKGKGKDKDKTKIGIGKATLNKQKLKLPSPSPVVSSVTLLNKLKECYYIGWGTVEPQEPEKVIPRPPDGRIDAQLRDLADELSSAAGCPLEYIDQAFREAAGQQKFHVSYVRAILLDWLGIERNRSP